MCNSGWGWEMALLNISSRGVSNVEKTKGQYFLSKESYFFTLRNLVALPPQSLTGGLPALARGPGPWCWACSPAVAKGWTLEGPRAVDTTPHPAPPHARSQLTTTGSSFPWKRDSKRQWATAPNLGAAGWASCSWGAGEVEGLDRTNLVSLTFCVPSPRKTAAFETLSGGHFGEDAIFLCHVMLFPHLTLATWSPQSTAPTRTPAPLPWRSGPGLGLSWERLAAGAECQQ